MALGIGSFNLDSAISGALGRAGGNAFQRTAGNAAFSINNFNGIAADLQNGLSNPTRYLDRYMQSIANVVGINPFSEDLGVGRVTDRGDPVMNYLWNARIVGGSSLLGVDMHQYIDQIQTPSIRFNTKPVFREGKMKHYATSYSADDLNIHMYTAIDGTTFNYAADWLSKVKTFNGYFTPPIEYKRTVLLDVFDQQNRTVMQFAFEGCWPTSWESYTFDSGQGQVMMTQLTLSVDNMTFDKTEEITAASITSEAMQIDKEEVGYAGTSLP